MAELRKHLPRLEQALKPPDNPTRLRFLVLVQDAQGRLTRVRCCTWLDSNLQRYCDMGPEAGDSMCRGWDVALTLMIEYKDPKDMEIGMRLIWPTA